uniref:HNH endonuclease n=1 Tax=Microbacterium sp. K5D TaxID=2305436 RepID=UPI001E3B6443|nr:MULTISPECIES: HNH endonuclease [unclassified Microbacterium]
MLLGHGVQATVTGDVAVGCRFHGATASSSLGFPAVAHPFHHHASVELGEHARHLAHGGAHRVVGVVLHDLAHIGRVHRAVVLPHLSEDSLLHGEGASDPVEPGDEQRVDVAILEPGKGGHQAVALGGIERARHALIAERGSDADAPCLRVCPAGLLPNIETEALELSQAGHAKVQDRAHHAPPSHSALLAYPLEPPEVTCGHNLPCALCGNPIDCDLPHTDASSFAYDHVKSIKTHPELADDPANGQPSHKRCNENKGANDARPALGDPSEVW